MNPKAWNRKTLLIVATVGTVIALLVATGIIQYVNIVKPTSTELARLAPGELEANEQAAMAGDGNAAMRVAMHYLTAKEAPVNARLWLQRASALKVEVADQWLRALDRLDKEA